MEFQQYKGQILGTNDLNETRRIKVDSNGYVKTTGDYVDSISGAVSNIRIEHAEIHNGNVFSILYKALVTTTTPTIYIQIKTATKTVHFKPMNFFTDGDNFTIEFFESPTLTDGITSITAINQNRTSVNTPLTVFYSDPTVTSDGTKIDEFYLGGSYGQKVAGSDIVVGIDEIVLKPNTDYLYKITNGGTADANILMRLFFYEK